MLSIRHTLTVVALASTALLSTTDIRAQAPAQPGAQARPGAQALNRGAGMGPGRGVWLNGARAGAMHMQMAGRALRQLNLTQDQQAQLKALRTAAQPAAQEVRTRMQSARQQLRAAVQAEVFDEAAVKTAADAVAAVQADQIVAHARARADVMRVLTSEQQGQLKQWQAGAPRAARRR